MSEDNKNNNITPIDDITIEFVDHDEEKYSVSGEGPTGEPSNVPGDETSEKLRLAEEKLLRLRADFENYKKRTERDVGEKQMRSQTELLRTLLPFLDNLERAFEHIPKEALEGCAEGVTLSFKELADGLNSLGLEEITTEGHKFDPSIHESMGFEIDPAKEENEVVRVLEKGYMFKGKLLRPARVFINRKEPDGKNRENDMKENSNG